MEVHCDLEVLRQAQLVARGDWAAQRPAAVEAPLLAWRELSRDNASLSGVQLEVQNEQLGRYLLDLSWQKDALKAGT